MIRLFYDLILDICRFFLNDITIKGSKIRYDRKIWKYGVCQFVIEYIQNLDWVLINCELDSIIIEIAKSQWYQKEMVVLDYLCSMDGCVSDEAKVRKLYEWTYYENVHQIRVFLDLVGYFKFMVLFYVFIIKLFSKLLKKGVWFKWTKEAEEALMTIRNYICESTKVIVIGYEEGASEIIFMVDTSLIGWDIVLL